MKTPTDTELLAMEEEDIPKRVLVQRLFELRAILDKTQTDSEKHWRDSVDSIADQFKATVQQERRFMDQKQADMESLLRQHSKEIEKLTENILAKFSQRIDEYMAKIDLRFSDHQKEVAAKLDRSTIGFSADLKNSYSSAKKELELSINNSLAQMQGVIADHRRDIDARMKELEFFVEVKTDKEVGKYMQNIVKTVNDNNDAINQFKKDMNDQITKYQSDTGLRVSGVNQKLEDVLGKLRGVLKDL